MKKIILILISACLLSFNALAAVNINTASQTELETLRGIGPKKAKAIIKYRKSNGRFKSVSDLENVKGIGPEIVKKVRRDASTSGRTTIDKSKKSSSKKTTKKKLTKKKVAKKEKKKTVSKK